MPVVHWDHVIQAFATNRSDQPFAISFGGGHAYSPDLWTGFNQIAKRHHLAPSSTTSRTGSNQTAGVLVGATADIVVCYGRAKWHSRSKNHRWPCPARDRACAFC